MTSLISRIACCFVFTVTSASSWQVAAAEEASALTALVGPSTPLKPGMKIAFFGDSLTMQGGFIETLKKSIAQSDQTKDLKIEFFQHGLNGGRIPTIMEGKSPWGTTGGKMQELLQNEKPDIVIIFAGVNDVWHGPKGTTPEDFKSGSKNMVAMAKAEKAKVILATLALIGERPDGKNGEDAKLDQYAEITLEVAKESGAVPVEVRKAFLNYLKEHNTKLNDKGELPRQGFLTYDGVHLSDKGNTLLSELIAAAIITACAP
jgi:lysophospholipase L1-like esterase